MSGAAGEGRANGAARAVAMGPRPRPLGVGRLVEGAMFSLLLIPLARFAPWLSRWLRPAFVWIIWLLLPARRRSLRRTARILLGTDASDIEIDRHGRAVMFNVHAFIADVATIDRRSVDELAARVPYFEGLTPLLTILRESRGAILAGAHLGSFESSVAALRAVSSVPVHILFARDALGSFDRIRSRARKHLGIIECPVDRGVEAWISLREALERGEIVAILADRVLPGQRGALLPFFGESAFLPTGPVRLATITGAPILPTFMLPGEDGLGTLRLGAPIHVKDNGRTIDANHPAQRALIDAMERAIRAVPEHWLVVDGPWADQRVTREPPSL